MDPDRSDRVRRAARPHRAAAPAGGRPPTAGSTRERSRTPSPRATCCRGRPRPSWRSSAPTASAARPGAVDRRARIHRPRGRDDPRALGAVPRELAAAVGTRRRRRGGRRSRRGRRPCRRSTCSGRAIARARDRAGVRVRWLAYLLAGGVAAASIGPYLVLVLLACGLLELVVAAAAVPDPGGGLGRAAASCFRSLPRRRTVGALAWTAFKVGALAFGGGFVIIPLMQGDAVHTYHWMTNAQFLNAVALGQVTPGPVVATVAAVGYAATASPGACSPPLVAFTPSFSFVLLGGSRFERAAPKRRRAGVPRRRRAGGDRRDPRRRDPARRRPQPSLAGGGPRRGRNRTAPASPRHRRDAARRRRHRRDRSPARRACPLTSRRARRTARELPKRARLYTPAAPLRPRGCDQARRNRAGPPVQAKRPQGHRDRCRRDREARTVALATPNGSGASPALIPRRASPA